MIPRHRRRFSLRCSALWDVELESLLQAKMEMKMKMKMKLLFVESRILSKLQSLAI